MKAIETLAEIAYAAGSPAVAAYVRTIVVRIPWSEVEVLAGKSGPQLKDLIHAEIKSGEPWEVVRVSCVDRGNKEFYAGDHWYCFGDEGRNWNRLSISVSKQGVGR